MSTILGRWWKLFAALRDKNSVERAKRLMQSWFRLESLEERVVLSLASPPDQALAAGTSPLATALVRLNPDTAPDLAVLGHDGKLTTAINSGLNSWLPASVTNLVPRPI